MDEYDIAALDEEEIRKQLRAAQDQQVVALQRLAQVRIGYAIALLRQLAPDATSVDFEVSDNGLGGKRAVVHFIGDVRADELLEQLTLPASLDHDLLLVPVENFLASAVEAGARFTGDWRRGNYTLRLVR